MSKFLLLIATLSILTFGTVLSQKNDPYEFINNLTEMVNPDSLARTIQDLESFVSRFSTNPNRTQIVSYLKNRFESYGCDIEIDTFPYISNGYTFEQYNVIGKIYGTTNSTPLLIGAHYDSCCRTDSSPGADDNASGVATVIEAARIISQSGFTPRRTIYFGAWAAEEQGLLGSRNYAHKLSLSGIELDLAINLDMIATNRSENYKVYVETSSSVNEQALFYANLNGGLTLIQDAPTGNSDHASFRQYGYPILYFHEYYFSSHYHTPRDLFIHLDMNYCARVTQAALANLYAFSQMIDKPELVCVGNSGTGMGIYAQWLPVEDAFSYRIKLQSGEDILLDTLITNSLSLSFEDTCFSSLSLVNFYITAIDSSMFEGLAVTENIKLSDNPLALGDVNAVSQHDKITLSWKMPSERDLKEVIVWVREENQDVFVDYDRTNPYLTEYDIIPEDSRHLYIKLQCIDSAGNSGVESAITSGALAKFDRGLLVISDVSITNGFSNDSVRGYFRALNKVLPTTVIRSSANMPNIYKAYEMVLWHSTKAALSQKIVRNIENLIDYVNSGGGLIISADYPQKMFRINEQNSLSVPRENPVNSFLHISKIEFINGSRLEQARSNLAPTLNVDPERLPETFDGNLKEFCAMTPVAPLAPIYTGYTSLSGNLMNNKTVGILSNENPKLCVLGFPMFYFNHNDICDFVSFLRNEWDYTSIPALDTKKSVFSFYPNPAGNMVTVTVDEAEDNVSIEIFDLQGTRVIQLNKKWYEMLAIKEIVVNISKLQQGIYFIKVNNKTKLLLKR
ncbi:MAG TPA: M20/M25/M40 family metallo-hydrolase [Salinivirgaceae bacterium]|nr:M20/M25/M40 family metallo-hydrolase [Salinivirgaceae bacterium]HQA75874.1 M20/M25/M40 family metallo-hydrolase [Salinivirgaceae bacterium]